MGTVCASAYANLPIGYREIIVYSIICQSYTLASKHFENVMLRFLGDSQILLKIIFIKPDDLLPILNQVNNDFQFTTFFRHHDKQYWCKNLDVYLQQTKRLKTI